MAEEQRPPYVVFETREVEDRDASIAAGHYVGKDVIFALVTPTGSKDRMENEAEVWLLNMEEGVKQERIPGMWLDYYRKAFEAFKESRDVPESGTPIITWPGASPSQIKLLLDINVRTVEELAVANEETINRIGMGARALKQKAATWLETADDTGKISAEIEKLRIENAALKENETKREKEFNELKAQVKALPKKEDA